MRHLLSLLALSLFLALPAAGQGATTSLQTVDALRTAGRYMEAVSELETMLETQPGNPEVLWRLARTRVDLGETIDSKDEQKALYSRAMADADAAVAAGPNNAHAHLVRAIAAGRVALISDTKKKIELSRQVKESADRAIALDSKLGLAYHVRGRWNFGIADLGFLERTVVKVVYGGLPSASFEQARDDFKQAIRLDNSVVNHLELGKTYLELGEKDLAKAEFQTVRSMPIGDPDDAGHKKEAAELLARLK